MQQSSINFRTEPIVHLANARFFTLTEPNFYHSRYKPPFNSGPLDDSQKPSMKSNLTIIHFEEGSPHNKSLTLSNCKIEPPTTFRANRSTGKIETIIKETTHFNDEYSTREWFQRKRSVSFANIPEKKRPAKAFTISKFEYLQRCSKESEIMKYIVLRKKPFLSKMLFFLKKFIIYHIFAALLSLLFIGIQGKYSKYCNMSPNCFCNDDLLVKVFVAFKEFFIYWIIYIIAIIQSAIIRDLFHEKTTLMKIIFFCLSSIFTLFYVILTPEENYTSLYVYMFYMFLVFTMEFYSFYRIKLSLKKAVLTFLKINQVAFLIFFNYIFYRYFYKSINDSILTHMSSNNSKNIINLYLSLYTLVISFFLKKFVLIYSEFLILLNQRNTYAVINIMRITLCLFMSLPAANLLKFDIYDWGGWLLLLSFGNFLMGFYFKIDFLDILFKLIKKIFKISQNLDLKRRTTEEIKCKNYIEKLFSGCVLDIQLVSCFRLIILYCSKHWGASYINTQFYKDCSFEVEGSLFIMSLWGVMSILIINVSLAVFIFFYMIRMRNLLILYKIKHNFVYNVYFLFLTHMFFEANLNMFYLHLPTNG